MATSLGLYWYQALLISMLTLTSAGQLATINIMINPYRYLEMILSQSTINIWYSFVTIGLSQKTDSKFMGIWKWLLGFFITDEIFAVATMKKEISRSYFFGLSILPWFGWNLGTLERKEFNNSCNCNFINCFGNWVIYDDIVVKTTYATMVELVDTLLWGGSGHKPMWVRVSFVAPFFWNL